MTTYRDYPFFEIAEACGAHITKGRTIFQKWSCAHCGARQTMDKPNTLFTKGKCEECGHVTDIRKHGCNYALAIGGEAGLEYLAEKMRRPSK